MDEENLVSRQVVILEWHQGFGPENIKEAEAIERQLASELHSGKPAILLPSNIHLAGIVTVTEPAVEKLGPLTRIRR